VKALSVMILEFDFGLIYQSPADFPKPDSEWKRHIFVYKIFANSFVLPTKCLSSTVAIQKCMWIEFHEWIVGLLNAHLKCCVSAVPIKSQEHFIISTSLPTTSVFCYSSMVFLVSIKRHWTV